MVVPLHPFFILLLLLLVERQGKGIVWNEDVLG